MALKKRKAELVRVAIDSCSPSQIVGEVWVAAAPQVSEVG
jgi:hypothetical protein